MQLDLVLVNPESEMCDEWRSAFAGFDSVTVIEGMYEDLPPHDCFVTAANSFGLMTAGIDAAVVEFHGQGLMDRLQLRIQAEFHGEQPVGTAILEPTGTAGFPFVVHAPTMRVPKAVDGTDAVYIATWAALVAIYTHNTTSEELIRSVGMQAMGAGFGNVPFREAARQLVVACENFLHPPAALDWDAIIERHKRLSYDGDDKVVNEASGGWCQVVAC